MSIYDGTFWDNSFWYPPGDHMSWEQFEDADTNQGIKLARPKDLFNCIYYIGFILLFRLFYEKFIGRPLAKYFLGRKSQRKLPAECQPLELLYLTNKSTPNLTSSVFVNFYQKNIEEFKKAGLTNNRKISNWYKRRRNLERPDLVKKFSETSYRFIWYVFLWFWSVYALYDKPWLYDTIQCWIGFPYQELDFEIYFLYMIQLSFYCTLALSIMTDIKRKDFNEQIIHHFATITLLSFSYMANFYRVGSLVLIINDCSDIILEFAKLTVYCQKQKVADSLFTIFAVVFLITRNVLYPVMVLHTTLVKSMTLFTPYFGYYAFNAFLSVIAGLNFYWSFLIVKMAMRISDEGGVKNDERSDAEELTSEGEDVKDK